MSPGDIREKELIKRERERERESEREREKERDTHTHRHTQRQRVSSYSRANCVTPAAPPPHTTPLASSCS